MMYVKDDTLYTPEQVRNILNASFSDGSNLEQYGYFVFEETQKPVADSNCRVVASIVDNKRVWEQIPLTQLEIEARRREAYQVEADPLFFKWQRGESTEQDWLDKIAEIKAKYPEM